MLVASSPAKGSKDRGVGTPRVDAVAGVRYAGRRPGFGVFVEGGAGASSSAKGSNAAFGAFRAVAAGGALGRTGRRAPAVWNRAPLAGAGAASSAKGSNGAADGVTAFLLPAVIKPPAGA